MAINCSLKQKKWNYIKSNLISDMYRLQSARSLTKEVIKSLEPAARCMSVAPCPEPIITPDIKVNIITRMGRRCISIILANASFYIFRWCLSSATCGCTLLWEQCWRSLWLWKYLNALQYPRSVLHRANIYHKWVNLKWTSK